MADDVSAVSSVAPPSYEPPPPPAPSPPVTEAPPVPQDVVEHASPPPDSGDYRNALDGAQRTIHSTSDFELEQILKP